MFNENIYRGFLTAENFGRNILVFDETDSTTIRLLEADTPYYTVAVAESQTAGRGRSGRKWISESGVNLCFSVNLPPMKIEHLLPFNIAVGFAVCDVLRSTADVKLKWPNDLMAGGKKLGGILFETSLSGSVTEKVILGIGINVNMTDFPAEIKDIATSLREETGLSYSREELLAELMNRLDAFSEAFLKGSINIGSEWKKYSASLDKKIAVHKNGVKTVFTERGITPSGFLIAEDEKGLITEIVTGDVGYDFSG
ncbi:biotin--[acetyl-CoA-carboxylase] ligase [Geovibrio thiophilus]|nr:biotin--[acetyl-CoA-carboxylase] ligase [Geovibrio thiophilus]